MTIGINIKFNKRHIKPQTPVFRPARQVAEPGAKFAVYDYMFSV